MIDSSDRIEFSYKKLTQIFDAGWLGKGDEKLTKTLSESQSLPTSKLGDFENFVCSKWIDMLNMAWTGNSYKVSGSIDCTV